MKAQRMKARGRNQERQLLDQLQRIQQSPGHAPERYEIMTVDRTGRTTVFEKR